MAPKQLIRNCPRKSKETRTPYGKIFPGISSERFLSILQTLHPERFVKKGQHGRGPILHISFGKINYHTTLIQSQKFNPSCDKLVLKIALKLYWERFTESLRLLISSGERGVTSPSFKFPREIGPMEILLSLSTL